MRSLNLDQLRALVEVVELGSFSAAARRLNLTQPAVSLQIRELETRLAVPLLKRVGKKTYPTAAGRELIDHAHGIFDSTNRALASMRRHKDGSLGWVHIGSGPAALRYLLLPLLERLREEHPTVQLAVSTGNTSAITERLSRNAIDLGFTGLPVDRAMFEVIVIRDMKMVAILSDKERDLPETITPADIAQRPLIVTPQRSNHAQLAREWLRTEGLEVRPAMEIDEIEVIKKVVAAGLGVALVPEEAITHGDPVPGLQVRPLDPPVALSLGLIWRRNSPDDEALRIVREAIMTLAEPKSASREFAPPGGLEFSPVTLRAA